MIDTKEIIQLAEQGLAGTDRYLVHAKVNNENVINVVIDSDSGVTIEHCIELSRFIEHQLDRDKEDFALKVLSSGLEFPFTMLRQYKKHIGKLISINLNDGNQLKGILQEVNENQIVLLEEIEKKYKKRTKIVQGEMLQIPMSEIKQAKAVIKF